MNARLVERIRRARRIRWALDSVPALADGAALAAALRDARTGPALASILAPARRRPRMDAGEASAACALLLEGLLVPDRTPVTLLGDATAELAGELRADRPVRLEDRLEPTCWEPVTIAAGVLGAMSERRRRRLLNDVAASGRTLIALEPLWPDARAALAEGRPAGRPRTRAWWWRTALRAGLSVAGEARTGSAAVAGLALRRPQPVVPEPAVPRLRVHEPLRVHVDDDLSLSTSFAWISAALALALEARGARVTIEPCAVSPAMLDRRDALRELMAQGDDAPLHFGWTHYWPQYQRRLRGTGLELFAINHRFADDDRRPLDAWLGSLAVPGRALAPISTFCQKVLVQAGVAPADCHVVPMGRTPPAAPGAAPERVPGADGLAILHVTNSMDPERHGTDLALRAFEAAFAPPQTRPATLVVRDYGVGASEIRRDVARLRDRGLDVRYWPVFYAEPEMARVLRGFDLVLAPFRGEGFGIKLLDAMAAGLPLVAPRFGGPADFFTADTGYPVDYELVAMTAGYDAARMKIGRTPLWARASVESVANALTAAADAPEERRARGDAAARASAAFTWDAAAAAVEAAFAEALSRRAG